MWTRSRMGSYEDEAKPPPRTPSQRPLAVVAPLRRLLDKEHVSPIPEHRPSISRASTSYSISYPTMEPSRGSGRASVRRLSYAQFAALP